MGLVCYSPWGDRIGHDLVTEQQYTRIHTYMPHILIHSSVDGNLSYFHELHLSFFFLPYFTLQYCIGFAIH